MENELHELSLKIFNPLSKQNQERDKLAPLYQ